VLHTSTEQAAQTLSHKSTQIWRQTHPQLLANNLPDLSHTSQCISATPLGWRHNDALSLDATTVLSTLSLTPRRARLSGHTCTRPAVIGACSPWRRRHAIHYLVRTGNRLATTRPTHLSAGRHPKHEKTRAAGAARTPQTHHSSTSACMRRTKQGRRRRTAPSKSPLQCQPSTFATCSFSST
jgi:hypothetical protein